MDKDRRWLLGAIPAALMLAAVAPARAATRDLALACDTTLGPAMRAASDAYAAATGVHVRVFAMTPGLLLPQLAREVQNDILVTRREAIQRAEGETLVDPGAPAAGPWRNRLLMAGLAGADDSALTRRVAATDPSAENDLDGPATLARAGIRPGETVAAFDTNEVMALVLSGRADAGLLHATDLNADPRLRPIRPLADDAAPPMVCQARITRLARRPDPAAFIAFLTSPAGTEILTAAGLETVA